MTNLKPSSHQTSKRPYRAWSVRTVVVQLSRKLKATYRIRGERCLSHLLAALLAGVSPWAMAELPTGLSVVAGQATASMPNANSMRINQATDKAILNWQTFNIGAGQSVQFVQPATTSVALNRIVGNEASSIYGSLTANGQVFLVNPAGVMFAPGAQVNVGGQVASSLAISNEDFVAGRYTFSGLGTGAVENQGSINAARGGYVLLAAPQVANSGSINADAGSVGLVAGSRVTLDASGMGLVRFSVDAAAARAAISNSGSIAAKGGQVAVLASAVGDALATVINQSGVIRADSAVERNGMIVLSGASTGVVRVSGQLTASGMAAGQAGGTIKVLGDKVALESGARLDASGQSGGGTVLVGGNYQGKGTEQNAITTFVDGDVRIAANAQKNGDGGTVIVWADDTTRFNGQIAATGAGIGGNGGMAEVSGKRYLAYEGHTDLAAGEGGGTVGTLLLDPSDITISTLVNSGGLGAGPNFSNGTGVANLNVTTLLTQLGSANVIINTSPGSGGTGNITVSNAVAYTGTNARTLTLAADGNINVNAAISSSTSSLSTNLNAGGTTTFGAAGSLTTRGGDVAITGTTKALRAINTSGGTGNGNLNISGAGAITQTSGALVIKGATTLTAGSGNDITLSTATNDFSTLAVMSGRNVTIRDANALVLGASSASGNLAVTTAGAITQSGGLTVAGTTAVTAGAANDVTLTNTGNDFTGAVTVTNGRNVAITDANDLVLGAITTTGASNANGGNVTVMAGGVVTLAGNITSSGGASTATNPGRNAGAVSITGAGITLGTRTITASGTPGVGTSQTGGNGNSITLTSSNGITGTGLISANGGAGSATAGAGGNAGNIAITNNTAGVISTGALTASTGAALLAGAGGMVGTISVTNNAAGQDTTVGALTATGGANGEGGSVNLNSAGALTTSTISTAGGAAAVNTAGRKAGNVTANAAGLLTAGTITASGTAGNGLNQGGGAGGVVNLASSSGNLTLAAVNTSGGNAGATGAAAGGNAGTITLDAGGTTPVITLGSNLSAVGGNRVGAGVAGSGGQVWAKDATTQTANLTVNTAGGATGGTGGNIRLDGAANEDATARTLTLTAGTGAVTLGGGVATNALSILSASGTGGITLGSVQTKGAQSYTGATSLNGNLATLGTAGVDTITFGSPVVLTGNSSITTAGGTGDNINITQTVNGAFDLALNAGTSANVTTSGLIGQTTALGAFSATGASVSLGAVRAASILGRSTVGNLTLTGAQAATGTGDSVTLVAKQNFNNAAGAAAINAGPGRWLVYSTNSASDVRGGLTAAFKQYNAAYGATVLGSGNGFVSTVAPVITAGLTGAVTKTYDGNNSAALVAGNYTSSGAIEGDAVVLNNPTSGTYDNKNAVAGKTVTVTGVTASATNGALVVYGYQVAGGGTASGNIGTINKANLALTAQADIKGYDGNTTSAGMANAAGLVGGDTLALSTQVFDSKNAGARTLSIAAYAVNDGNSGNNYNVTTNTSAGSISQKTLAVTGQTAASRVYDATTNASLSGGALTGVLGGETVNLVTGTGSFADKNVGSAKPVTVTGSALGGADAGNYTVANPTGLSATITRANIANVSGITAANKPQDGTTAAVLSTGNASFTGKFGTDVLTVATATGVFDTPAVGTGKAVSISGISLGGTDAGNYNLTSTTAATTASILNSASFDPATRQVTNALAVSVIEKGSQRCEASSRSAPASSAAGVIIRSQSTSADLSCP